MADTKKYVSVFSDGTDEFEIKDAEARAAIGNVASVATCQSIIDELS